MHRRFEEAKAAYQRVLEIDYRNVNALSFMGVTHHLLGNIEAAIVKYHEVCCLYLPYLVLLLITSPGAEHRTY